jgi:uncharacterized protein (TIGR02145 family)
MLTAYQQVKGTMKDPRDGKVYATVSYNDWMTELDMVWMAENLSYAMEGATSYKNKKKYDEKYGLFYSYEAAKNACPPGWHLPGFDEWTIIQNLFGGYKYCGSALKSIKGWKYKGNGTNSSDFNALPVGFLTDIGEFESNGLSSYFWSGPETEDDFTRTRSLDHENSTFYVNRSDYNASYSFSCRCVKNKLP